ncbi:amidohydrolase [Arthrobacter crystallopoietes]|nr:amidohydrolase [Arthrobacter crystallopoietes]
MRLEESVLAVDDELLKIYKQLHANPELSMAEFQTSAFIRRELEQLGFEVRSCGGTGLVGTLKNGAGPSVAFRADMDGLPVREETGASHASAVKARDRSGSEVPVMHACGHDIHMTVALGLARQMKADVGRWSGTLILIFQPGEETGEGARAMLDDGLWDIAQLPDCVFGLHVWPLAAGSVELVVGDTMAMGDSLRVTVKGIGGHGSQPQDSVDPVVIAANMVVALQSAVSRNLDPLSAGVVTVGTFHAGTKENIIPAEAEFTINIRSIDLDARKVLMGAVERIIGGVASAFAAPEPSISVINSFPHLYSDPVLISDIKSRFDVALGETNVRYGKPRLASEDFGLLGEAIGAPSAYWFIGGLPEGVMGNEQIPRNHSPFFYPDPVPTLEVGIRTAYEACLSVLDTNA